MTAGPYVLHPADTVMLKISFGRIQSLYEGLRFNLCLYVSLQDYQSASKSLKEKETAEIQEMANQRGKEKAKAKATKEAWRKG